MRVIKFRAWDKQQKKMIYFIFKYESCQTRLEFVSEDGEMIEDYDELMQFTGLCDCNGREIYEGDLLNGEIMPSLVKFGILEMNYDDVMDNISGFYAENLYTGNKRSLAGWITMKVIGNIYENPELVKGNEH